MRQRAFTPTVLRKSTHSSNNHGKLRLVLDLRHVNKHLQKYIFKYENIKTVTEIFEKDYYFVTFDLKSGYHHIKIAPEYQKFLGFTWTFSDGSTRYFEFVVLPFGLAAACYVFTKVLRPLVKRWRGLGIRCILYIDDGIIGNQNKSFLQNEIKTILDDLKNAGFTINIEKSNFNPTQYGKWLGFEIDTKQFKFFVPNDKIMRLELLTRKFISSKFASARDISQVAGSIISMTSAIGPLTNLLTRNMYFFINEKFSWDKKHALNDEVLNELKFWSKNVNIYNGFNIRKDSAISKVVYSDASKHSFGGVIISKLGNQIARDVFTKIEKSQSSTYRELIAVKYVLESFSSLLLHEKILWHSDNLNTARIIQKGSRKPHLQKIAFEIFELCLKHDIVILTRWVPREQNTLADEISKYIDSDDWGIDFETFEYIQQRYGNFTFDRFASSQNTKVDRFNSKFYCPGSSGVNAFTHDWSYELNWLCPPISLIGACLRHMKLCKARGVLFIPEWKSAYFWPLLTPNGRIFYDFVKEYLYLQPFFH